MRFDIRRVDDAAGLAQRLAFLGRHRLRRHGETGDQEAREACRRKETHGATVASDHGKLQAKRSPALKARSVPLRASPPSFSLIAHPCNDLSA